MSTDTTVIGAERLERRLLGIRPQIWLVATLILLIGAAGSVALYAWGQSRAGDPTSPYEKAAITILASQGDLNTRWNELVTRVDASSAESPDQIARLFIGAGAEMEALVSDTQAVITEWRKLEVPPEFEESHDLALEAMTVTQDGFIYMEDYFKSGAGGVPDDVLRGFGVARLEDAAKLWEQARSLELARGTS